MSVPAGERTRVRRKVRDVLKSLESVYGVPLRRGRADPLDVLVETILSQNTNDRNRDVAHKRLKTRFPTWDLVARAADDEIADAIRPGGLANQKAKYIKYLLAWVDDLGTDIAILDSCRAI